MLSKKSLRLLWNISIGDSPTFNTVEDAVGKHDKLFLERNIFQEEEPQLLIQATLC